VRSSAYGSRFRVQGLESGNVDPMRATPYLTCCFPSVYRSLFNSNVDSDVDADADNFFDAKNTTKKR
jgi:hypothetical protein